MSEGGISLSQKYIMPLYILRGHTLYICNFRTKYYLFRIRSIMVLANSVDPDEML